jgi:hypothetical protein
LVWLFFFSGVARIPYCLVPILRSSTHGFLRLPVKSSIRMNCSWRDGVAAVGGVGPAAGERASGVGKAGASEDGESG